MFRRLFFSLQRFMMGRNGFDRITKYALVFYCVLVFISTLLLNITRNIYVYLGCEVLIHIVLVYIVFRVLSRNVSKRRAECARFDIILEKLGRKKKNAWQNPYSSADYNNYNTYTPPKPKKPKSDKYTKYVTCKNCKAVLRLKRRKGIHTATCAKCGKNVKVISFR